MCSNDYLGLANHAEVVAAGHRALDTFGAGTSAARFVCGTNTAHRELEDGLAGFLGTEAALSFGSGFAANTGLIPAITQPGDAIVADAHNHPSSADGCRLAAEGVAREVYAHGDMSDLEDKLAAQADAGCRFIVSDGVFGSAGDIAKLDRIVDISRVYEATVVIDDSARARRARRERPRRGRALRPDGRRGHLHGHPRQGLGRRRRRLRGRAPGP